MAPEFQTRSQTDEGLLRVERMMNDQPKRVVLFGELLMRLATPRHERFPQAQSFEVGYTGGEANAGALLAGFGVEAVLLAAVPDNDIGQACIHHMRRYGMDTTHVERRGPRLGTLYLEIGASQRPSKVIYDRAGSSFSQLRTGDIAWQTVLQGADWLHFTGTAPALSPELAELTAQGCQIAKSLGITVSCDLNYRSSLWSISAARETMTRIVADVDVLIVNEEHARQILDAPVAAGASAHDPFDPDRYGATFEWLRNRYGLSAVALTVRSGSTSDETLFAGILDDGRGPCMSSRYAIRIVDRIGAGDAFAGGLIYGLLEGWPGQRVVDLAAAAACLKHTIHGDFCIASLQELLTLAEQGGDGRVMR